MLPFVVPIIHVKDTFSLIKCKPIENEVLHIVCICLNQTVLDQQMDRIVNQLRLEKDTNLLFDGKIRITPIFIEPYLVGFEFPIVLQIQQSSISLHNPYTYGKCNFHNISKLNRNSSDNEKLLPILTDIERYVKLDVNNAIEVITHPIFNDYYRLFGLPSGGINFNIFIKLLDIHEQRNFNNLDINSYPIDTQVLKTIYSLMHKLNYHSNVKFTVSEVKCTVKYNRCIIRIGPYDLGPLTGLRYLHYIGQLQLFREKIEFHLLSNV